MFLNAHKLSIVLGEGGTFALFQGLFPPEETDYDADRNLTGDSHRTEKPYNQSKLSMKLRWPLLVWVSDQRIAKYLQ